MANRYSFTMDLLLYCNGHGVVRISDLSGTNQLLAQNGTVPYSFIFMIPATMDSTTNLNSISDVMMVVIVKYRYPVFLVIRLQCTLNRKIGGFDSPTFYSPKCCRSKFAKVFLHQSFALYGNSIFH